MQPEPEVVSETPAEKSSSPRVGVFLSIVLIVLFLYRAFTPGHEFPSEGLRDLTMIMDGLCLICVIGLWIQGSKATPAGLGPGMHFLFLMAVLAGLGLFAIRSTSNSAFWTGHIGYELEPRSDRPSVESKPSNANVVHNDPSTRPDPPERAAPGTPSAAYQAFYAAVKNKDIATMKSLISKDVFSGTYSQFNRKTADGSSTKP
jgi:hypothetical protein